MNGPLARISRITDARTRRISSYDRTGANMDCVTVPPGGTHVVAEIAGSGCITHMWFTMWSEVDTLIRSHCLLRIYWDGADEPSVEAPIGEFFGNAWGENYLFSSLPLVCGPRDGRAMTSYWPMAFRQGARVEVVNQSEATLDRLYFYVDYEEREVAADEGYFHAQYRQELTNSHAPDGEGDAMPPVIPNQSDAGNYVFLDATGQGHYVGVNLYVESPTPLWYGEGDDMFRIDGEEYPYSLHGTGTEDYFNTAWSPEYEFQHPYFGLARVPGREPGLAEGWTKRDYHFWWLGRTHCYRFHMEDPVRFRSSLRASLEHGHANTLSLMLRSVAYWYQSAPVASGSVIPPVAERQPMPPIIDQDIHHWRDTWMKQNPGDAWGNGWRTKS